MSQVFLVMAEVWGSGGRIKRDIDYNDVFFKV